MILANIFRKVKEARQLGESHAQDQEEFIDEKGGTSNLIGCLFSLLLNLTSKALNMIRLISNRRQSYPDYITADTSISYTI